MVFTDIVRKAIITVLVISTVIMLPLPAPVIETMCLSFFHVIMLVDFF